MPGRPKLPSALEEQVLSASRRRCALCFGLSRDATLKVGQLAHIDRDAGNTTFDNLAFLCLPHHEAYDSTSRQAKGLTLAELSRYRNELYEFLKTEWSKPTPLAPPLLDRFGALAGHYVFEGSSSSAEFQLAHLGNGVMQVSGFAVSEPATPVSSAHTGSVDFVSDIRDNRLYFADRAGNQWYNLELTIRDGAIQAVESENSGYQGLNVSFAGSYRRA
jgi:hypothetical protein